MKLIDLQFSYDPETYTYSGIVAFRDDETGRVMTQSILDSDARTILESLKWRVNDLFGVTLDYSNFIMPAAPAPAADALPPPETAGLADVGSSTEIF